MKKYTFVALLRGINVGGNNKVEMKRLKQSFEGMGMESVITYINTGNIVFKCQENNKKNLSTQLEKVIESEFDLKIKVLIRSFEEMKVICQAIPKTWKNDKEMKADVLFLWEEVGHPEILEKIELKEGVDEVSYIRGALLWKINRSQLSQSKMNKLVGTALYKKMTVRNVNTVRKVFGMMERP